MQEAELLKICVYYLAQTEMTRDHIDLRPFENCYIVWCQPCVLALKSLNTTIRNDLCLQCVPSWVLNSKWNSQIHLLFG